MKPKGNKEEAYLDFKKGLKYKDIAARQGVSVNTVKSWAIRYKWKECATAERRTHLFIKRLLKKDAM